VNRARPRPKGRRGRKIRMLTVGAVVLLVLAGIGIRWWPRDPPAAARRDWQPPAQQPLAEHMRLPPVPGWRLRVGDLGLPSGSRIFTTDSRGPLVGTIGDHVYFLAGRDDDAGPQWWLVGVDVGTGRALFPALPLDVADSGTPSCVVNGPTMVLCVRDTAQDHIAWVVDDRTGSVTYTGPTEVGRGPGAPVLRADSGYAVATTNDGVFGVGPRAELTWYVPGVRVGDLSPGYRPPSPLTRLWTGVRQDSHMAVVSLADGSVVGPQPEADYLPGDAAIYPGGFAVEMGPPGGMPADNELRFFTGDGRELNRVRFPGGLVLDADLPIGMWRKDWVVFTPDGRPLLKLPAHDSLASARLVGSTLFVFLGDPHFPKWAQFDLRTGERGPTCELDMYKYLGTDGQVAVFAVTNPAAPIVLKAADLNTCEILWRLPKQPGLGRVWRVNDTLVRLSDDGTELMSLVARR